MEGDRAATAGMVALPKQLTSGKRLTMETEADQRLWREFPVLVLAPGTYTPRPLYELYELYGLLDYFR